MSDRTISDADIKAIITAMIEHEEHCRFKSVEPKDLHDVMTFVRAFSVALEEGKSVVRKTLIVLFMGGIVAILGLGSVEKLKQIIK
jgi:hypothetical protein